MKRFIVEIEKRLYKSKFDRECGCYYRDDRYEPEITHIYKEGLDLYEVNDLISSLFEDWEQVEGALWNDFVDLEATILVDGKDIKEYHDWQRHFSKLIY